MGNSLIEKMIKAGTTKHATLVSESAFFQEKEFAPTNIPIIDIACSGRVDGGVSSGLTFLAGESKNFKSLLGLLMVKAYLDKYPEAICCFYDSEFGVTPEYLKKQGIDTSRMIHIPITNIEELKFDITNRLDSIERGDKVFIFIDSIGNLASKKEAEDALDQKSAADMTRAKVLKSLWRIVTPELTLKDIPCVAINHTYNTMELYSKAIMSGGQGGMLSANQVFIITKAQEKESGELKGYKFTINIEKSRFVREKSKFPFVAHWETGINKWSGLLDIALEGGFIVKPTVGWYSKVDTETGEIEDKKYRAKETDSFEFWNPILSSEGFQEFIKTRYAL